MKRFFLVFAGLLVGFAAGSWTPLGDFGSLGNIKSLALKSDRLSSLVGSGPEETAHRPIDRAEFQPFLSLVEGLHTSTISLQNRDRMIQALVASLNDTAAVDLKGQLSTGTTTSSGRNAIFADSPNAELMQVIGAIEAENQEIALYLQSQSPSSPEYHLTRSIYESNNQWLETLRFMVQKNNGSISATTVGSLTPLLESLRQKVEESSFLGRRLVSENMRDLVNLETVSAEEKAFKDLLIAFVESYGSSFEIEETLATVVTDYPLLVGQAMTGQNMTNEIANWDMLTLQLVTERMELKQLRLEMAADLSGPVS